MNVHRTDERFGLYFGALTAPIEEQLKSHGYTATEAELRRWQHIADAITTTIVHGVVTHRQGEQARQKLMKKISNGVVPIVEGSGQ